MVVKTLPSFIRNSRDLLCERAQLTSNHSITSALVGLKTRHVVSQTKTRLPDCRETEVIQLCLDVIQTDTLMATALADDVQDLAWEMSKIEYQLEAS